MANLTNSGKLITKIEGIDSSISSINDKIGSIPTGTDIGQELSDIKDSIGALPEGKTAAEAIADAAQDAADVASDLASFETDVANTYATKDSVASAFLYKGTKNNYSDLPATGNKTGDVWNIVNADASHDVKAGDNVVWNGEAWDVLSGVMDLSNYFNKSTETADAITEGSTHLFLTSAERTKLGDQSGTNTGDETQATIKNKLGAASTSQDGYLTKEDFDTFNGKQDAISDLANIKSRAEGSIQATDATFVSNTVVEGSDGKVTVTAADNVTVATAESNNKSAIANLGTAHNNLVDRVEAVESATGSLPFEAYFVNGTFSGKVLEISNANILATSHVSYVVTSGALNGYYVEREVQAGKVTLTSSDNETCTVEVMIINKKSS